MSFEDEKKSPKIYTADAALGAQAIQNTSTCACS